MSKYIKLDEAINAIEDKIAEYIPVLYGRYCEMPLEIRMAIESLPTIEVSEDALKGCDKVDKRFSEDAISREDAVNALIAHFIPQTYTGEQVEQASKLARKIMANAPSVLPKPKEGEWIPCSERLPKKEETTYLICTEDGYMCSCRWTNDMYGLRSNEWSKWGWHIMDKPQYAKVVAWMPLKPWKGAE